MEFIGFIPLRNMIQVERLSDTEISEGGVVRPDIAQQKTEVCKVLAIGPLVTDIEIGDYIQVRRYSGSDQNILGKETVVLDYEEVMGKYIVAEKAVGASLQ
jgi:co-chaperonin GroES (HSP10)